MTIFADLLAVGNTSVERVRVPWMLLYLHALLVDDSLDGEAEQRSQYGILAYELFPAVNRAIWTAVGYDDRLASAWQRYTSQACEAMRHEVDWSSGVLDTPGPSVVLQQGRKAALAKFCAALLVHAERDRDLAPHQEEGIDALCSGIQLLDDYADMREDHKQGRRNCLLQTVYRWLSHRVPCDSCPTGPDRHGDTELLVGLALSGAATTTWSMAAERYERSLALLQAPEGTGTYTYFVDQIASCRRSCAELSQLLEKEASHWSRVEARAGLGISSLHRELDTPPVSGVWRDALRILETGPRACN